MALPGLFPDPAQKALLFSVFAVGHGSQFAMNVPVALKGRRGEPVPWRVLSGTMLFIFTIDGLLTLANAICAALLASD